MLARYLWTEAKEEESRGLTDGNLPIKRSNWTVRSRERERESTRDRLFDETGDETRRGTFLPRFSRTETTLHSFSLSLSLSSWLINRPCQTLRNHANGCSFVISCFMERDYVARRVGTRRFRLDRRYLASLFFFYPQRERNEIISSIYFSDFHKRNWESANRNLAASFSKLPT